MTELTLDTLQVLMGIAILFAFFKCLMDWNKLQHKVLAFAVSGLLFLAYIANEPGTPPHQTMLVKKIMILVDAAMIIVGIHYAKVLGVPAFRFILSTNEPYAKPMKPESPESSNSETDLGLKTLEARVEPSSNRSFWFTTLGMSLGMLIYTIVLFKLTNPRMSEELRHLDVDYYAITLYSVLYGCIMAVREEFIYRLFLQNVLNKFMRTTYSFSLVITAIFFTVIHEGMLDPNWIKMVQIFPFALGLGWAYKRHGIECTILIHVLFNFAISFFPRLVSL